MTQPIHIMLDLETWGTEPGCDIRSIGACVFDPVAGTVCGSRDANAIDPGSYFYVATDNPTGYYGTGTSRDRFFEDAKGWQLKYPLNRDPNTVKWWSEQSDEAQAAFADPVDLKVALSRFACWLEIILGSGLDQAYEDKRLRLWAHGPQFDISILAAAYRATGASVGSPVPWHYRAPRDTRTAFDMARIDDHSAWLKQHPGPLGIAHHSLDDSICQARAVCAAYQRISVASSSDSV